MLPWSLHSALYLVGDGHVVVDPLEHPRLGQRLVPLGHLVRVPAQDRHHEVMLGPATHWSAWIRRWSGQFILALHL